MHNNKIEQHQKKDVFSFYNYTQLAPQPSLLTTAEDNPIKKQQQKLHTINQLYLNEKQKKPKTKIKIFLQSNLVVFNIFFLKTQTRTSLVQWLRFCASNAGGPGSIPGWGTRSHTPELKISHVATETWRRQINNSNKTQPRLSALSSKNSSLSHGFLDLCTYFCWLTSSWLAMTYCMPVCAT